VPGLGCLNFHPAYLPQYRGTSPVFWCLASGETQTGYSIHFIDEGVDTGPLLKRAHIPIEETNTEHSLYMKCVTQGAEAMVEAFREVEAETYQIIDVSGEPSSYFSKPTRDAHRQFKRLGRRFFKAADVHRVQK
jgi:methionyl-tRNA formyltransferase